MKTLFVIGTPIGNLGDISSRALEHLKNASVILCEDTRVTKKLLSAYEIDTKTVAVNQHTSDAQIIKQLEESEGDLVFVSDAGTPGISDPGGRVVALARKMELLISPIPGASAMLAILSVCGFPAEKFTFLGFPPHKKGRAKFFSEVHAIEYAVVLFESKHRIEKSLMELPQDRYIVLGRELTKQFETLYYGNPQEVKEALSKTSAKGEFVIAVAPKHWKTL